MPDTQPQRLPLVVRPSNRGEVTSKDARLINGYIEVIDNNTVWVYKRPGLSEISGLSTAAAAARGVYNFENVICSVRGNTFYYGNFASGTVNDNGELYSFSTIMPNPTGPNAYYQLFMHNGSFGYVYDIGLGLRIITDSDFSAVYRPGIAYLDGTAYVLTGSGRIQGSALNNPMSWDPLNYIIPQIEPDKTVAIAKQLVYVVAFKQWSVEIFYDAGNPTGSPLGAVQGAKVSVGCRSGTSIQDIEGTLLWIAQARDGSTSVWAMDNLKAVCVSTPAIDRLLQQADYTTVYSWHARFAGHKFYAVTLVASNLTLVYDLVTQTWYQWTDSNGNYLPFVSSTFTSDQQCALQHATNGKVYKLELTNTTDAGSLIPWDLYTPNFDGNVRLKKYLKNVDIIADKEPGSFLQVRCSDDDYQTWSNYRTVDLSTNRPRLTDCGTFRRRAYHFHHECNTPLRIQAVELQLDLGTL